MVAGIIHSCCRIGSYLSSVGWALPYLVKNRHVAHTHSQFLLLAILLSRSPSMKKKESNMSAIKVNFEIGHEASLRSKKTPEGFTHDWEVFVRGQEGADISYFVDKVVFHLHETFPKPRRVVKEPPFSIKESGYAGFVFPIEIYLKNKDEPKKIKFTYDFTLQQSGFLKDRFIFQSPNEEFRKKLIKGGGIPISNNAYYTNPDQESKSRDSFTEEKQQLVSKPKLSTDNVKKHKSKEPKEEIPHRTNSFETLFGAPIQKPPKVSPEPKKLEKSAPVIKSDKKDKERSNSEKKSKHEHKEVKPEKIKVKEEKDRVKSEKVKSHSKDADKIKEKSNKRPNERPPSPDAAKKRCISPARKPSSPPRSSSASSFKDEYKPKHSSESFEQKKPKPEEKPPEIKVEKDVKEKKKKEKKSHDRDKERKEKKEHRKEGHKSKESPKEQVKEIPKEVPKPREVIKEKDPVKDSPSVKEKPPKSEKTPNKFSIESLRKTPPPENEERTESQSHKKEKGEERKHKHKKKDKKRDESREKNKESNKEKKHKHEKREIEKPEVIERRPTPVPKERAAPEPASPISIDTASQCSSKSGLVKASHIGAEDINSSQSDSESSVIAEDENVKVKVENQSPETVKREPSPEPEPEQEPEVEPELAVEPPIQHKEKSKKHKDKSSKRQEKRRKRKAAEEENSENRKNIKTESGPSNDNDRGETSGSSIMSSETKVQDNGVSSSLGEDAEPGDISPDYMVQLRGLQQRIMMIKNNEDLERVVNLIAETGRYEVTTQTFDFDLCLLDRSTVQQLIQLVGC